MTFGYANDSKWLLVCLAMTGNVTATEITNASYLDNGSTHSFRSGNDPMIIFFTKEQVIPRFLIEYE